MWRKIIMAIGLVIALWTCSGCATVDPNDPDRQSDIPWNESKPWESAPGIPGFDGTR